jgi:hypothetical protein
VQAARQNIGSVHSTARVGACAHRQRRKRHVLHTTQEEGGGKEDRKRRRKREREIEIERERKIDGEEREREREGGSMRS